MAEWLRTLVLNALNSLIIIMLCVQDSLRAYVRGIFLANLLFLLHLGQSIGVKLRN